MRLLRIPKKSESMATLGFVILCSVVMILDSIIVRVFADITAPSRFFIFLLFDGLLAFFVLSNYIFLRYSKEYYLSSEKKFGRFSEILFKTILLNQLVLCGLICSLAVQAIALGAISILVLASVVFISHISAIGYLGLLTYRLFDWFRSNQNYLIFTYAIAFSILILTLVTSIMYLSLQLSYYDPMIKVRSISTQLADSPSPTEKMSIVALLYDYFSVFSFVLTWIPTVFLLKSYSVRIGKMKYWIIVTIPVIYYLIPLTADQFGMVNSLRLEYGRQFELFYNLFFSPYKQVGGLLFGLIFWIISLQIKRTNLQIYFRMAGAGMILLFGSTVIHGLTYIVAPPFGLITISYMGLASYMLSLGILSSTKILAKDSVIRRELYQAAGDKIDFMQNLSLAEVERSMEKSIKPLLSKMSTLEQPEFQSINEKEDLKDMIRDVIDEIKARKKV